MDENKISIVRVLDAPIENVWDAWTKPENLMQWKAPGAMSAADADVSLEVGEPYSVTMVGEEVGPTGKVTIGGVYKTIEKPNKLVFTWKWEGQDEETLVSVLLKSLGEDKTELTLIHEGFATVQSKERHAKGWESTLTKLGVFLNK